MPRPIKKGAKYAISIAANFFWMFTLYRICIFASEKIESAVPYMICSGVFLVAASVLLMCYYAFTNGASSKEEKDKYKILMVFALPLVLVLLLDVAEAVLLDNLINMFTK